MKSSALTFMQISDVLQFAMPIGATLSDISTDLQKGNFHKATTKSTYIALIVLMQIAGTIGIKAIVRKPRPCYVKNPKIIIKERDQSWGSFPSGHMAIAVASTCRIISKYGLLSFPSLVYLSGSIAVGLGRYLPEKHDKIDLLAGGMLGLFLGQWWNNTIDSYDMLTN